MKKGIMLFNKICMFMCLGLALCVIAGCSANEELEPGRCNFNPDCKGGTKCNQGWCEDIYHPKKAIQPL